MNAPFCLFIALFLSAAAPAPLQLRGHTVFEITESDGAAAPSDRARAAEAILTHLADDARGRENPPELGAVHIPPDPQAVPPINEGWSLRVDGREFLRLTPDDVLRSGLPADVYVESLIDRVQAVLLRERRQAALRAVLQAISLTVFLGLLTFLALRAISGGGQGTRVRVEERLARLHGVRLRGIEIVSPATLEGTSYAVVGLGRIALQIALVYGYLAFALSQFAFTRGWVAPLTALVTSPFVELLGRIGGLLSGSVLLVAGVFLLRGGLRLVHFLLQRVARGEFKWTWLPPDLVPVVLPLVQGALVLAALIAFAGLAGGPDGLLTHLLFWLCSALALAAVPALAAGAVGTLALMGRRYQVGEWIAIGSQVGEVTHVGFFAVTLVPVEAGQIRVPHLLTLWTPVRHLLHAPPPAVAPPGAADPSVRAHTVTPGS